MQEDPAIWEQADISMPIYSVVCTDTSSYAHWQCELLEYSWKQVAQPGELIRLVSCRENDPFPSHRYCKTIPTNYTNEHPVTGDRYVPYNRLYSFREWLANKPTSGTVLILDPDCVFRDSLPLTVSPGRPIGQRWRGFAMSERWRDPLMRYSSANPEQVQAITWPCLIHTDDLGAIIDRWIDLTAKFRTDLAAWESDMMAFVAACAEIGLRFEERHLVAVMNWPEEGETAPIIHYCQPVDAKDGSKLWGKQGYQPWSDTQAEPSMAKLEYCQDLIAILNEYSSIRRQTEAPSFSVPHKVAAMQLLSKTGKSNMFQIRLSLRSGAKIELSQNEAGEDLAAVFSAFTGDREHTSTNWEKLISVATSDGNQAHFHPSQIVSIETIPINEI